ncbi:hypothetical protein D3C80_1171000 [compost metagenome]
MCQHDDRFNTLALQFFSVFLDSRYFFIGCQELNAYQAGWSYFAWRSFCYHTDKSDFHAAYFFNNIRVDDWLLVHTVNHVGIDVIKVCASMSYIFVLRINTAENLCFQCFNALVKFMVTQCSDVELHQVHPFMGRLITLK